MVTSLDQLFEKYKVSSDDRREMKKANKPRQTNFVSLVQNFTPEKVFSNNLEDYRNGYRLVPYGHNIFGLIAAEGYQTFSDDFTLNTNYEDNVTETDARKKPIAVLKFNKEEYLFAKDKHANYWEWKNNRNEMRSELEEQFGYDTKHAMHLVRLLRMGVEILTTGEVVVKRPDASELLNIRGGAWKYEELVKYAEDMDQTVRGELYKNTSLPKKPNIKFAAQLLMDVQDLVWSQDERS